MGEKEKNTERSGRCVIVAAGDFFGIPFSLTAADLVIAADAGLEHCRRSGIKANLLVGDLDSVSGFHRKGDAEVFEEAGEELFFRREKTGTAPREDRKRQFDIFSDAETAGYLSEISEASYQGIPLMRLDTVKNDSDVLAAIRIALGKGYREFHILGGLGKRCDHSIANLQNLSFLKEQGAAGYLYSETEVMTVISGERLHFPKIREGNLSVFSLSDESSAVCLSGLRYLLKDATLRNDLATGLSNEFIGEEAEISCRRGKLLVVYPLHACGAQRALL